VTSAFGSLWVSNYFGASVSRIDPATGKVVATIETDLGGQIMATLDGSLWLSSVDAETVSRIDPVTNEVAETFPAGDAPDGLLALDGVLWVVSDFGPELRRLDPSTGELSPIVVVGEQGLIGDNRLAVEANGFLWLPLFEDAQVVAIEVPEV
jgi:streptogramin lyase